MHHTMTC